MSKIDDLSSFILQLVNNNIDIKIVALQEIWSLPHPELVNIPGFKLLFKARKNTQGGGEAFFVKDGISCKIIDNLSIFIEKEFECITIETTINKQKCYLSNIYRSPNPPPALN